MRGYPGQREPREVTLQKMRDRAKRLREADREGHNERQRVRYIENRDAIRAQNAASYQRHREKRLAYQKALAEKDTVKHAIKTAKRVLAGQTGVRIRDIPDDLAEAKALQLAIRRYSRGE